METGTLLTQEPMNRESIVEFVEKRLGIKLLAFQKDLLNRYPESKNDLYVMYGRKGNIYICEKEEE